MGAFDGPLDDAATLLGLRPEPDLLTSRYSGAVRGVSVGLWRSAARSGEADATVIAVPPRRPDLGLHVRGAAMTLGLDRRAPTGDADFDGVFDTFAPASEVEAVRKLLSRPLRRGLQRLAGSGWPTLVDDAVVFLFSLSGSTVDEVRSRVQGCVECALEVSAQAASLDAPHPLLRTGVAAAFEAEARARGMAFERNALRAAGVTGRGHLTVTWRVRAPVPLGSLSVADSAVGWRAHLRFEEPLGVGLTAHRASFTERVKSAVGLRDLQVGDADFDRAWTLAARDESGARAMLHPRARRVLEQLAGLGLRVSLDDEGLRFEGELPRDPEVVTRTMALVDGARDALRPQMGAGPYR